MEQAFETGDVRGILHTPERPTGQALALTHGAGSDAHSPLLAGLSRAFCDAGLVGLRYDLPYRVVRPKGPPVPGAARDREGVLLAVAALRGIAGGRVFAGGHSYGGRQSAMAAAEHPEMANG